MLPAAPPPAPCSEAAVCKVVREGGGSGISPSRIPRLLDVPEGLRYDDGDDDDDDDDGDNDDGGGGGDDDDHDGDEEEDDGGDDDDHDDDEEEEDVDGDDME